MCAFLLISNDFFFIDGASKVLQPSIPDSRRRRTHPRWCNGASKVCEIGGTRTACWSCPNIQWSTCEIVGENGSHQQGMSSVSPLLQFWCVYVGSVVAAIQTQQGVQRFLFVHLWRLDATIRRLFIPWIVQYPVGWHRCKVGYLLFLCLYHHSYSNPCLQLLPKLYANGHKVLIFSQMVRCLDLLEEFLKLNRYKYERLDGSTSSSSRAAAVDRFIRKACQRFVMLLSTRVSWLLNFPKYDYHSATVLIVQFSVLGGRLEVWV
jgi:hypothetical protein